jgi:hypothetical protein
MVDATPLIVGCGPTSLMVADGLLQRGISGSLAPPGENAKAAYVTRATVGAVSHRYGHPIKCAVAARQAVDGFDCDQVIEDRRPTAAMAGVGWFWLVPTFTWITQLLGGRRRADRDTCNSIEW